MVMSITHAKSQQMDAAVLELLKPGPMTNRELREKLKLPTQELNQALDRSLQRLKKAGTVYMLSSKWALTSSKICPGCLGKGWVHSGG